MATDTTPRLSQTLFYPPDVCQQCGCGELFDLRSATSFWHDASVGMLQRWQEHDEQDQPERVLVILCEACAEEIIEPHPRLYRRLQEHEPWPGCMPLCRDCVHRNDVACEHPNAKGNGGPGIELIFPKPLVAFLDGGAVDGGKCNSWARSGTAPARQLGARATTRPNRGMTMADKTGIEWTDATWNPVRGCTRISEGCRNCYAEKVAARFSGPGMPYEGLAVLRNGQARWTGQVRLVPEHLEDPVRWRKPRRIFVNSMSDLFHESLTNEQIASVFQVICKSLRDRPREKRHTFQILTKRAERLPEWFDWAKRHYGGWFGSDGLLDLGSVQLGVSIENQASADERAPYLFQTPVRMRWFSVEPLLGEVNLKRYLCGCRICVPSAVVPAGQFPQGVDWVVVGGESGPGARPLHPGWVRQLRDQCQTYSVPFFFKQWGEWKPISEMAESESDALYEPAPEGYEDLYTRRCRVPTRDLQFDGGSGYRQINGHLGYLMFRVGKKQAGRTLDGRTWDQYPEGR